MEAAEELLKPGAVFSWVPSEVQNVIRATAPIAHPLRPRRSHCSDINIQPLHQYDIAAQKTSCSATAILV